jgi:hypothetical protein
MVGEGRVSDKVGDETGVETGFGETQPLSVAMRHIRTGRRVTKRIIRVIIHPTGRQE